MVLVNREFIHRQSVGDFAAALQIGLRSFGADRLHGGQAKKKLKAVQGFAFDFNQGVNIGIFSLNHPALPDFLHRQASSLHQPLQHLRTRPPAKVEDDFTAGLEQINRLFDGFGDESQAKLVFNVALFAAIITQ